MQVVLKDGLFGFFIKWRVNLRGLLNAKAILEEDQKWHYSTHSRDGEQRIKVFIPFPRGISPKVKVIARLEYELVYNDIAVQQERSYAKGLPQY